MFSSVTQHGTEFLITLSWNRETGKGKREQETRVGSQVFLCQSAVSQMALLPPTSAVDPLSSQDSTLYEATPFTPGTPMLTTMQLE